MDDHHLKEEEHESVGELSAVFSHFVMKCLYLARIGRLDIFWSVNKLARAVTKWTRACDKRLAPLISYISSYKWIRAMLLCGKHSTAMQTLIVSRLWFCRRPWRLKINIRRGLVFFGSHTFFASTLDVQETDFSFTQFYWKLESFFSMQVLRMDGFAALDLWDLVMEVFDSFPSRTEGPKIELRRNPSAVASPNMHNHPNQVQRNSNKHWSHSIKYNNFWFWCFVVCLWGQWGGQQNDYQRSKSHNETCFTDPQSCSGYCFLTESMWTQKFKSVTLTPNINSQTCWLKGILHVMSGTIFFCCSTSAMLAPFAAPRISAWWAAPQWGRGYKIKRKKQELCPSRDSSDECVFFYCDKFLHRIESDCIEKSGDADSFVETRQQGWVLNQDHSTQRRRLKCDTRMHTLAGWWESSGETRRIKKKGEEEKDSEDSDNPAAGTWYNKEELVARNFQAWVKPLAHGASCSVCQESQKNTEATWDHCQHTSPDTSHYMEAIFSMVRKICRKPPGDPMEDANVNLAIWEMFRKTTLRAAVHLGKDYDTNLRSVKKYLLKN